LGIWVGTANKQTVFEAESTGALVIGLLGHLKKGNDAGWLRARALSICRLMLEMGKACQAWQSECEMSLLDNLLSRGL
jgi:hypothetical protein